MPIGAGIMVPHTCFMNIFGGVGAFINVVINYLPHQTYGYGLLLGLKPFSDIL